MLNKDSSHVALFRAGSDADKLYGDRLSNFCIEPDRLLCNVVLQIFNACSCTLQKNRRKVTNFFADAVVVTCYYSRVNT